MESEDTILNSDNNRYVPYKTEEMIEGAVVKEAKRMIDSEIEAVKREISKVNDLRHKFWTEYNNLKNWFVFKYPIEQFKNDTQWNDLWTVLCDMYLSTVEETIGRMQNKRSIGKKNMEGLYINDKLCHVCRLPLDGKKRKYCSPKCKQVADSRKYRKDNPEKKELSNLKYLKEIHKDLP